ncbi:MAG: methionyl-tRNA formyltransferase [Candidatus Omnitrophica bacterium]|nr:methionyl-tRNA formyltransferase [Candidatus Omnitrophota bacterium]MDD5488132.1 methionyl-tRNA formyltransferase [Candidatus Omnitrophota bacterium]
MKIIFFGTGSYSIVSLKRIVTTSHELVAVVTQPDKKKGRGWNMEPSPVKAVAGKILPGMDVFQPEKVSDPAFIDTLRTLEADVFVVVDYGQILTSGILSLPGKYCVNLHPSLLPRHRGASPVNYTILKGDPISGNTVIRMNERMDAGDIILQSCLEIRPGENAGELLTRLSTSGAELLVSALDKIAAGTEQMSPQDDAKVTYAPRLKRADGEIDWTRSAEEICRMVRAFYPWPGTYTYMNGRTLKILEARECGDMPPGPAGKLIVGDELIVNTSQGGVRIGSVQLEGKKPMDAVSFMRGLRDAEDVILGGKK